MAGMSLWQLDIRYDAWLALAVARAAEDQVCFNGGNITHQEEEAKAWQQVAICAALIAASQ